MGEIRNVWEGGSWRDLEMRLLPVHGCRCGWCHPKIELSAGPITETAVGEGWD